MIRHGEYLEAEIACAQFPPERGADSVIPRKRQVTLVTESVPQPTGKAMPQSGKLQVHEIGGDLSDSPRQA